MNNNNDLDARLVEQARRGDRAAFDLLVRKYQNKVLGLIGRFVNDLDEAYDIAQETFIRAYRSISSFRGESAFYTWLYRIAVNTAKNHLQQRKRRMEVSSTTTREEEAEPSGKFSALRDNDTPDHLLARDEILRIIGCAVADLPEELRLAITLREVDGLSYQEISEVMDCPIGTVRSRIFRARETITNSLNSGGLRIV